MRINYILYILAVVIVFAGCNHVNRKEGLEDIGKEYTLKSNAQKELFMASGRMAMADSLLVIVSLHADDICKLYTVYDKIEEVCTYGKKGNGPNEFIQPLLTYAYGNMFGLNEVNKQELVIMNINKGDNGEVVINEKERLKSPYKREKGKWNPANYYFVRLDSLHYVSLVGVENGHFFTLSDSTLSPINHFGDSPIEESLSPLSARNRLNGKIVAHNGKMVFATTHLPYLASYSIYDGKMEKEWSLFYAQTGYGVRNGDLLFDKEKAIGPLLDIKIDSRYIYVLHMNQLLSDYDYFNAEKSSSDKVLVFDYNGNKVATLNLDCRIQEMAIASKCFKLFGITQQPDLSLVEFSLPKELYN